MACRQLCAPTHLLKERLVEGQAGEAGLGAASQVLEHSGGAVKGTRDECGVAAVRRVVALGGGGRQPEEVFFMNAVFLTSAKHYQ